MVAKMEWNPELYDGRIQTLLAKKEQDWGSAEENRANIIPLGLGPIDHALWGMNTKRGDLFLWIGEEKQRKSTAVRNVIVNIMRGNQPAIKPATVIDVLESGEPPEQIRDHLICIVATRLLVGAGHKPRGVCPVCKGFCQHIGDRNGLSPEFLLYGNRTQEQQVAVNMACAEIEQWPLRIFGPNPDEGNTRDLDYSRKRWEKLYKMGALQMLVVDHAQEYETERITSDFEKQTRAVAVHGTLVAKHRIIDHLVSQVSLTSIREASQGMGKLDAAGGRKAAQEANVELTVEYKPGQGWFEVTLSRARRAGRLTVVVPIDDTSGSQIGEATLKGQKGK